MILAGCLIAALTYFPLFHALTSVVNPQLEKALETVKVEITADPAGCGSVFDPVGIRQFTAPCDTARRALATAAIPYKLNVRRCRLRREGGGQRQGRGGRQGLRPEGDGGGERGRLPDGQGPEHPQDRQSA